MALTATAVPLWLGLTLIKECRSRAAQAFGAIRNGGVWEPREEMRLHAALGASMPVSPEMGAAFIKVLEIAEDLGDREYQLRALRGLYFYHIGSSRYLAALPFAQKFHDLAMSGSDQTQRLFGERMMGAAKHFLGDQIGARRHLEQVLAHYVATDHGGHLLDVEADALQLKVEALTNFHIALPESEAFLKADPSNKTAKELAYAEQSH